MSLSTPLCRGRFRVRAAGGERRVERSGRSLAAGMGPVNGANSSSRKRVDDNGSSAIVGARRLAAPGAPR
jgi:hypothetical protein